MTMKTIMLVIVLAHGGYWFGGNNDITVRWAVPAAGMPAAVLSWQLSYGAVQLASKEVEVMAGEKATTITLQMSEARTPVEYTWTYVLKDKQRKVLEQGERTIHLLPAGALGERVKQLKGKSVVVVENRNDDVAQALKDAGLDVVQVTAVGDLQLRRPDVVLVGQDELGEGEAPQGVLLSLAKGGATVVVFSQSRPEKLFGFSLRERRLPGTKEGLTWRCEHAMFEGLDGAALEGWAREAGPEIMAVALPTEAAVLELGCWTRETPGKYPVPIDALAATQTVGNGRIVYWQIPVREWKSDPRAQMLLANVLDYALIRPEPTLPQALREEPRPEKPAKEKPVNGAQS
jgi:hypothetical protein